MKFIFLAVLSLTLILFCSGCYLDLLTSVTETEPVMISDEVLLEIYRDDNQRIVMNREGGLFVQAKEIDVELIKEILSIEGMVAELGETFRATFTEVAREEIKKNKYIPHKTRQIKSLLRIGTKRELGQVGSIVVPLGKDNDSEKQKRRK